MKRFNKIYLIIIALIFVVTSCDNILEVNSDKFKVIDDSDSLNTPSDTLYTMIGIMTKLQHVAERYVILGELRGDLMTVSDEASADLKEIYNFEIAKDNEYNVISDYYAIINNCNYLITRIDTSLEYKAENPYIREYAAALSIRAWTYMQIFQNYGEVKYYDQPILSTSDIDVNKAPVTTADELISLLAPKLEEVREVNMPDYDYFDGVNSEKIFFPVRCVLGDLYLLGDKYEDAAKAYYEFIFDERIEVNENFQTKYSVVNEEFVDVDYYAWYRYYRSPNLYYVSYIASSNETEGGSSLTQHFFVDKDLLPSQEAINHWNDQVYYHDSLIFTMGDLRGYKQSYTDVNEYYYNDQILNTSTEDMYIRKFAFNSDKAVDELGDAYIQEMVMIYRQSQLYLRFAEAVNRAGKPNLAFAVLKNGLVDGILADSTIIPKTEDVSDYRFPSLYFGNNIGVHALGSGNVSEVPYYKIPELSTLEDSILYVEDQIVNELSIENAFEGNRFYDLMRIANRRGDTDYLASIVSKKYGDQSAAIREKLNVQSNWYLPINQ